MRYLGLEIGSKTIRLLRLSGSPRNAIADLFREEPIPTGIGRVDAVRSALQSLADAGHLRADVIAASVPSAPTVASPLTVPFDDPKVIQQILPAQMQDRLPSAVPYVNDFSVIGPTTNVDEEGFDVLVISYPERVLEEHLELLDAADVDPQLLLPLAYTGHRAARHLYPQESAAYAVVDIGAASTQITVMHGERFILSRTLLVGGQAVTDALAEVLECDTFTAEEFKRTQAEATTGPSATPPPLPGQDPRDNTALIQYAVRMGLRSLSIGLRQTFAALSTQHNIPIEQILLTGGGARLQGLPHYLSSELGVRTQRIHVSRPELELGEDGEWGFFAPLSLALAAAEQDGAGLDLNLRQGRFAFKGNLEFLKDHWLSFAILGGLLLIALIFMLTMKFQALSDERDKLQGELAANTTQLFSQEAMSQEDIDRNLARARGFSFLPTRTALDFFSQISSVLTTTKNEEGEDVYLDFEFDQLEVDTLRKVVKIKGNSDTEETLQLLIRALSAVDCFPENIDDPKLENRGGRVFFTMQIEANLCKDGQEE